MIASCSLIETLLRQLICQSMDSGARSTLPGDLLRLLQVLTDQPIQQRLDSKKSDRPTERSPAEREGPPIGEARRIFVDHGERDRLIDGGERPFEPPIVDRAGSVEGEELCG